MTVQGRIDNNQGESIVLDDVDRVARGFFWKDVTYGFENINGFIVYYKAQEREWDYVSLNLPKYKYDLETVDDMTFAPSNGVWKCQVVTDPSPNPKYDDVTCTREIIPESDYERSDIRY